MTEKQLKRMYEQWIDKHCLYAGPDDLDNAVSLASFDSGHGEAEYSGMQIFAVTKCRKGKIHMFVFALRSTWSNANDFDDDACLLRETYRKVISF